MALLGEEKVGLASSRQIGDTVACVEESWALVSGELSVGAESEGLVVAEAATELLVRRLSSSGELRGLTCRHGTEFASHPPGR